MENKDNEKEELKEELKEDLKEDDKEKIKQVEQEKEKKPEYSQEEYRNMFLALREKYDRKLLGKGSIEKEQIMQQAYDEVVEKAVLGDSVAQGLLSYWFKHGNQALPENIELSMKWLILSGSNENKHSIDRLSMLFSYVYDLIIFTDDFQIFSEEYGLTEENFKYCLGPMICLYIVKNMGLDALEVSKEQPVYLPFNATSMNKFTNLANKSVDEIVKAMKVANDRNL